MKGRPVYAALAAVLLKDTKSCMEDHPPAGRADGPSAQVPGLLAVVDQGLLQAVQDMLLLCGPQVILPGPVIACSDPTTTRCYSCQHSKVAQTKSLVFSQWMHQISWVHKACVENRHPGALHKYKHS